MRIYNDISSHFDPISIPVSGDSGFKNRLVLPHVQVPPTPFVAEVKYREFLPINMDGVMAIFEGDVYLISGVITCHTIDFPVIIVLEEQHRVVSTAPLRSRNTKLLLYLIFFFRFIISYFFINYTSSS